MDRAPGPASSGPGAPTTEALGLERMPEVEELVGLRPNALPTAAAGPARSRSLIKSRSRCAQQSCRSTEGEMGVGGTAVGMEYPRGRVPQEFRDDGLGPAPADGKVRGRTGDDHPQVDPGAGGRRREEVCRRVRPVVERIGGGLALLLPAGIVDPGRRPLCCTVWPPPLPERPGRHSWSVPACRCWPR